VTIKPDRAFHWILGIAAVIAVGVATWRWGGAAWSLFRDQSAVQAWIASFGAWSPLVSIALNAAQVIIAPLPGEVASLANGYLFGVWLGTLYNLIGVMVGSAVVLILARRWGRPLVTRLVHDHEQLARLDHLVARRGMLFFFLVFLLPLMPKDLACYAVGLTELPLGQMFVLIAIGRLPGLVIASWVGANATSLSLTEWAVLIVGACVLGLIYLRWGNAIESALMNWIERVTRKR
jgi:uncharacterized membrane protein YdjX (TVP38/TMEM64 family)